MSSAPNKRRKTSPVGPASVPLDAPATPTAPKLPTEDNAAMPSPNRASFLSPTRASLARLDPAVVKPLRDSGALSRPSSRGAPVVGPDVPSLPPPLSGLTDTSSKTKSTLNETGARSRPTTPSNSRGPAQSGRGGLTSPTRNGPLSPARAMSLAGSGLAASPRRRSKTPSRDTSPPKIGALSASPRRPPRPLSGPISPTRYSPARRFPRQTPSTTQMELDAVYAQAQSDEDNIAGPDEVPDTTSDHPVKPLPDFDLVMPDLGEALEPELPPTPTERGLSDPVMERPPTGLLNSPSRRPKRRKSVADKPKSSPLKTRVSPARDPPAQQSASPSRRRDYAVDIDLPIPGTDTRKEELRNRLLAELRTLQEDVSRDEEELIQMRSQKSRDQAQSISPSQEELNETLARLLSSNDEWTRPPDEIKKSARLSFAAFLPFSARPRLRSAPRVISDAPLKSHHPVELDDPLPYLQVFTPLRFECQKKILRSAQGVHIHHDISTASANRLLTATFGMTVETNTHSVINLDITSLSRWAEPELGQWIRNRAEGKGPAGKDILGVCWATARYWELAEQRAKLWARCEREFEHLKKAVEIGHGRGANRKGKPPDQKRGFGVSGKGSTVDSTEDRDVAMHGEEDEARDNADGPRYSRTELRPHLGRTGLTFHHRGVSLTAIWRITFDWTGEAESFIHAAHVVPESWVQIDSRGALSQVPLVFDKLLKQQGPFGAIKEVLGRLVSHER